MLSIDNHTDGFGITRYLKTIYEPMDDRKRLALAITNFKFTECYHKKSKFIFNPGSWDDQEYIHGFKSMVGKFKQLKNK